MKLFVNEPSTRSAGAIEVFDTDCNDIAEFFHNEHATVPQSYETALALARKVTGADLDAAWLAVNALGGANVQNNSYDQGIVDTVAKALEAIEALGGMDPKERARLWPAPAWSRI